MQLANMDSQTSDANYVLRKIRELEQRLEALNLENDTKSDKCMYSAHLELVQTMSRTPNGLLSKKKNVYSLYKCEFVRL